MYIHIGDDLIVKAEDIIAILDKQSVISSSLVEKFLKQHEESIINLSKKSYNSIVITNQAVYLSPFISGTIKRRSNCMNIQDI